MQIDLDALEQAARAAEQAYQDDPTGSWELWRVYMAKVRPPTILALIARLRAAEAALRLVDAQGDEPSPKEWAAMRAAVEATRPRGDG